MIAKFSLDHDKNSVKIGDKPWHDLDNKVTFAIHMVITMNKCKSTGINELYRYNKTVKLWLFRETGSIH